MLLPATSDLQFTIHNSPFTIIHNSQLLTFANANAIYNLWYQRTCNPL